MSYTPARIGRVDSGPRAQGRPLAVGEPANVTLVDPAARWTVDPARHGEHEPQQPVRRDGADRPGGRHVPARAAHGARRGAGRGGRGVSEAVLVLEDGRTYARRGLRRHRRHVRRDRLQHRHDRLPGDPDRPVVPPADRRDDRAAHRQHRAERRGPGVHADLGRRLRGARPGGPAVELAVACGRWTTGSSAEGIVGIAGVDTRALTRHLREQGVMRAGIFSGDALVDAGGRAVSSRTCSPRCGPARRWPGPTWPARSARPSAYTVEPAAGRCTRRPAADRGRRRPRHQVDDPAPARRARGAHARGAVHGHRRRGPRAGARTGCSSPTARATRAPPRTRSTCCATCSTDGSRSSGSASATRSSAGRWASAPTSWPTATAGSTSR